MTIKTTRRTFVAAGASFALLPTLAGKAVAQEQTVVEMLTKHPDDKKLRNVFYPRVVQVQAGDTVLFKATDKSHNSASIKGMLPEGAEDWKGSINKDVEVTFDKPGIYGYMCTPHATTGMVGLVVVEGEGKLDNLEAAQDVRQRGKAKKVFEEIWAEAEELGYLTDSTA